MKIKFIDLALIECFHVRVEGGICGEDVEAKDDLIVDVVAAILVLHRDELRVRSCWLKGVLELS